MFGYLVVLEILMFASIQARSNANHKLTIIEELLEQNDANLNEGFDINAFRQNQLDLHNYYRSLHGVPAMTRDETVTSHAQAYAEELAANDAGLVHCSQQPGCDTHNEGENLAGGSGSTTSEVNATKNWYDEIWYYNFCNAGKRPGFEDNTYAVGHFTQVVWKSSTKLGIGYARSSDKTKVYVVGRYLAHGNVAGQYLTEVTKPNYVLSYYQDNCDATNGGLSEWSSPEECSRSCGGGVILHTRTCTDPKPSLNGKDCSGPTKELVSQEWCNIQTCSGDKSHRDLQCEARGEIANAHNFGGTKDCTLHCQESVGSNTYLNTDDVDDGTHCNSDSGVCVEGVCQDMPDYFAPTTPPPTSSTGQITGAYAETPVSNIWDNDFFEIPNDATDVTITNNDYNGVQIFVGYRRSGGLGYNFGEQSWMSSYIPYTTDYTTKGVSYTYNRYTSYSTFSFPGPVQPDVGYHIVLYAKTDTQATADISWSYTAPVIV